MKKGILIYTMLFYKRDFDFCILSLPIILYYVLFKNCFKLHVNTQFEYKYFICLNQNINHSTEKQVANKKIGEFSAMEYGILH